MQQQTPNKKSLFRFNRANPFSVKRFDPPFLIPIQTPHRIKVVNNNGRLFQSIINSFSFDARKGGAIMPTKGGREGWGEGNRIV